ncbi:hypothetical protein KC343_g18859, partial [Hortaea werneckii]
RNGQGCQDYDDDDKENQSSSFYTSKDGYPDDYYDDELEEDAVPAIKMDDL